MNIKNKNKILSKLYHMSNEDLLKEFHEAFDDCCQKSDEIGKMYEVGYDMATIHDAEDYCDSCEEYCDLLEKEIKHRGLKIW